MEKNATGVAVTAIVGLVATVVVDRVMRAKERHQDATRAATDGRNQGWFEGRESVLQHFGKAVEPTDFNLR